MSGLKKLSELLPSLGGALDRSSKLPQLSKPISETSSVIVNPPNESSSANIVLATSSDFIMDFRYGDEGAQPGWTTLDVSSFVSAAATGIIMQAICSAQISQSPPFTMGYIEMLLRAVGDPEDTRVWQIYDQANWYGGQEITDFDLEVQGLAIISLNENKELEYKVGASGLNATGAFILKLMGYIV